MSLKFNKRSRSSSLSKSKEKNAKYISAAIIPSIAFIANPTTSTQQQILNGSKNDLFNSTLNSSILGMSTESLNGNLDYKAGNNANNSSQSINTAGETVSLDRKSSKKKTLFKGIHRSKDNSKRKIKIAKGLEQEPSVNISPTRDSRPEIPQLRLDDVDGDQSTSRRSERLQLPSQRLGFAADTGIDYGNGGNLSTSWNTSEKEEKKILFDQRTSSATPNSIHRDPERFVATNATETIAITGQTEVVPPPIGFESLFNAQPHDEQRFQRDGLEEASPEDRSRLQREEIRSLRDTVYRLNVELSEAMVGSMGSTGDEGHAIGGSVFPGRGPVPAWIMNTRYLTPLIAAHDRKFKAQAGTIRALQTEILRFEEDIRQILRENEILHQQLQEIHTGTTRPSNNSDWRVIAHQAKLLIEENRMLVDEVDLHQKKGESVYKENELAISNIKKSLEKVKSERNTLEEEVGKLTKKLAESRSTESNNNSSRDFENSKMTIIQEAQSAQTILILETKLQQLSSENTNLREEVTISHETQQKLSQHVDQLKLELRTDVDYKEYFSQVIDKSNEIAEEREELQGKLRKLESEVKRTSERMVDDIKFRSRLDLYKNDENSKKLTFTSESLSTLEEWIEILLEAFEDLGKRCRHQEKDVFYYQSLLKEKDNFLQQCAEENQDLESRLETILSQANL